MPEKLVVQTRKGKTITFPYGATTEKTKTELIVKGASGNEIGFFNLSELVGYWKEDIPLKLEDLSDELLDQIVAEGEKIAKQQSGDSPAGVAATPIP